MAHTKTFPPLSKKTIEKYTLRLETSHRGGGVEIDLTHLGYEGNKMTAYQNYLGGGMLGKIGNSCTISDWQNVSKLQHIATELSKYFHSLTNPEQDFAETQMLPLSAY